MDLFRTPASFCSQSLRQSVCSFVDGEVEVQKGKKHILGHPGLQSRSRLLLTIARFFL